MKKRWTVLTVLLVGIAPVWGADQWPEAFTLVCGDPSPEPPPPGQPWDGRRRPLVSEVLKGSATRIASRFAGGLGYRVEATVADENLTNSSSPVALTFTCDTRDPGAATARFECTGDLRTLASVPGFNLARATLPVPHRIMFDGMNGNPATVTIRWAERDAVYTPPSAVYFQNVREIQACRYAIPGEDQERATQ